MPGVWQDYYQHWRAMTRECVDERLLELIEPLRRLVPPAVLCDKAVHSAFSNPSLRPWLHAHSAKTLIVTGGETDVCVLATVMAAMDLGVKVALVTDALCSVSDKTHDALMTLYGQRFQHHIVTITTEEILSMWKWDRPSPS
jgi:nicotinamidase-related amidase